MNHSKKLRFYKYIFFALKGLSVERFSFFMGPYFDISNVMYDIRNKIMFLIFDSMANVLDHLYSFEGWRWGGNSSYEGLCEWALENAIEETHMSGCDVPDTDKTWIHNIIHDYLKSVQENPSCYPLFVSKNRLRQRKWNDQKAYDPMIAVTKKQILNKSG